MSVNTDSIPPPRLVSPAAEPISTDNPEAMEIFAIAAEKGAWKFQHPTGRREHNELHLPVGRPAKFTLTSAVEGPLFGLGWQHLEIPAFPFTAHAWAGRYSQEAVLPKRAGAYGLRNARERIGTVFVIDAAAYDRWSEGEPEKASREGALAYEGRQLFLKLKCISCHSATPTGKGPVLEGLYGSRVALKGGTAEIADEAYIIESIRRPRLKVVDGWEAIMPAYDKEQVSDEELNALVAYIKSLKRGNTKADAERFPPPVGAPAEPRREPAPHPREK
jgi:cytochrome c oxidase subunit 2